MKTIMQSDVCIDTQKDCLSHKSAFFFSYQICKPFSKLDRSTYERIGSMHPCNRYAEYTVALEAMISSLHHRKLNYVICFLESAEEK